MRIVHAIFCLLLCATSGCAVKDFGRSIGNKVSGDYYLSNKNYEKGEDYFQKEVYKRPYSSTANYYYARFLLEQGETKKALHYMMKSTKLEPQNVEYLFWQAFCYGELGQRSSEALLYEKILQLKPNHYRAELFLAHNLFAQKRYSEALIIYLQVLKKNSREERALYNCGLIYEQQQLPEKERWAWHRYLRVKNRGKSALYAGNRLLLLGDGGYIISHIAGVDIVTEALDWHGFKGELNTHDRKSLAPVAKLFSAASGKTLQIIVYKKGDLELARQRCYALERYFHRYSSGQEIAMSWFGSSYFTKLEGKNIHREDEVILFTTDSK